MKTKQERIRLTAAGVELAQAGEPVLRGYALAIHETTGVRSSAVLRQIEDTMRHVIFHSTLDWQDRDTFSKGAREAYGIVRLKHRRKSVEKLPEDEETARLLGVQPQDVAALAMGAVR